MITAKNATRWGLLAALVVTMMACNTTKSLTGQQFGTPVNTKDALAFDDLLGQMASRDSMPAKVRGTVESVCQMKGCWMNIVSSKPGNESMFVKFKDYGFFVPKDISGREVIMEGYAFREVTPVDELRHYAEDEGKSQAEIDQIKEPKVELKFLASGVLVLDKKP